ncbi:RsfA family transcriptional regulator [Bacillus sp. FSL K6-3431]|uniref:RsfA family transcriptional regulator n=1 Tax=Bacillus sp. FSL K6-3431 TaxID=2921500 RepID=UPI0030FC6DBF
MAAIRQDAWTSDEDHLLAELVLSYIKAGSTQLKAFEEAGVKLKRTPAACGFRWNSFVRKQCQQGIEIAKKERKNVNPIYQPFQEGNKILDSDMVEQLNNNDITIFFQKLEMTIAALAKTKLENQRLQREVESLNDVLRDNEKSMKTFDHLQTEYQTLLNILNQARERTSS